MITHYGVVTFEGDPAAEHEDSDLRGQPTVMTLIASGSEEFCWAALAKWTAEHPLREWEQVEVLARHPWVVRAEEVDDPPPNRES